MFAGNIHIIHKSDNNILEKILSLSLTKYTENDAQMIVEHIKDPFQHEIKIIVLLMLG